MNKTLTRFALLAAVSTVALASCNFTAVPEAPTGRMAYGIDATGQLASFGLGNAGASYSTRAFTGLGAGETLVDLDFWNVDSALYGLSSNGTLYKVDPATGALTKDYVGTTLGTPTAMDFNPVARRLRVFNSTDDNFRITPLGSPATAGTTADGKLVYAATDSKTGTNPMLTAAAYTNSFAGFTAADTATVLYSIDAGTDSLVMHTVGPAFSTLNTVGPLNIDARDGATGFDIVGTNEAYLSTSTGNTATLYTVNLTTGATTQTATINGSLKTFAVSLPARPAAATPLSK
ncbi:DUF4394 domain-containing protein [Deinococcus sp. QL22]|uniref:DUF4394 domain-containing protein n=1 Tax=Deinococcus sp. QL22 TaxID=2939437 RepID=UPI00201703DE|nr:DUF4394 domain-containing protein [Deinococcus sp. QL22]UQN04916.1 DUF4394 domain-containing protein [Deinococcus sp. QL22]